MTPPISTFCFFVLFMILWNSPLMSHILVTDRLLMVLGLDDSAIVMYRSFKIALTAEQSAARTDALQAPSAGWVPARVQRNGPEVGKVRVNVSVPAFAFTSCSPIRMFFVTSHVSPIVRCIDHVRTG